MFNYKRPSLLPWTYITLRYPISDNADTGDWQYVGVVRRADGSWKPKLRWRPTINPSIQRHCGECRFFKKKETPGKTLLICTMGVPVPVHDDCLFATYCPEFDV